MPSFEAALAAVDAAARTGKPIVMAVGHATPSASATCGRWTVN